MRFCVASLIIEMHKNSSYSQNYSAHFVLALNKETAEDDTTLQFMMNTKISQQMFWHCYENGLIKTIQTIPRNLYGRFKLTKIGIHKILGSCDEKNIGYQITEKFCRGIENIFHFGFGLL